jgi:hypothetical protein
MGISPFSTVGNETSTYEASDGDSLSIIVLVGIIVVSAICGLGCMYYCCCRESRKGYYDGAPADRELKKKDKQTPNVMRFDVLEEEVPRGSMDDITENNTTVNAASRFVTPEQYINLFRGNYQYIKSRRTSAHAFRLGLNKKTPLINTARELTPAEIQLAKYLKEVERQDSELTPVDCSSAPRRWVQWADQPDEIEDNDCSQDLAAEEGEEEEEEGGEGGEEGLTRGSDGTSRGSAFEWSVPKSADDSRVRKLSLVLTTEDISSTDDDVSLKVIGYNPQAILNRSIGDDKGGAIRYELSSNHDKNTDVENKKRFQQIFKSASFNAFDNNNNNCRRRESAKAQTDYIQIDERDVKESKGSEETTEETMESNQDVIEEDLMASNFLFRGSGELLPVPTRFSPPPSEPAVRKQILQARKKRESSYVPIADSDRPPPLKSPLVRQSSLDPAKLGKMLRRVQDRVRGLSSRSDSGFHGSTGDLQNFSSSSSSGSRVVASAESDAAPSSSSSLSSPLSAIRSPMSSSKKVTDNSSSRREVAHVEKNGKSPHSPLSSLAISSPLPPFPSGGYDMSTVAPPPPPPIPAENKESINQFLATSQAQVPRGGGGGDIDKFVKMFKVGIPPDAVRFKMEMSGLDPSLLDSHIDNITN